MGYLNDFLSQIHQRNFNKFLVLWEEYCGSDSIEVEEMNQLLRAVKGSELAKPFGQFVEQAIPLWKSIQNQEDSYLILSHIIDLQTTNSPELAEIAIEVIQKKYPNDPKSSERLRMVGLRTKDHFEGALAKYDLVSHMSKGNMVFHEGGWGTGEIIDVSQVREHLVIEFENLASRKDLSFANAFKTLIPLPATHFLARRFADPDRLEKEGKADPVTLVKLLLHDLGPKTAAEIKDELCELVIPENDWSKWWQNTRAKMKKDSMVEVPENLKDPFILRHAELTAEDRLHQTMQKQTDVHQVLQTTYSFIRDNTAALKNQNTRDSLHSKLTGLLEEPNVNQETLIQIHLLLEQFFDETSSKKQIEEIIKHSDDLQTLLQGIDIAALKKRALLVIKDVRKDWVEQFLDLLFILPQLQLKDYLLKELNQAPHQDKLQHKLHNLLNHPASAPEVFIWYFQKLITKNEDIGIPFSSEEGKHQFFEGFLILLSHLENQPEQRELVKKIMGMIANKRYELIRDMLHGTSLDYTKEILLLSTKCRSLTDHDIKILRSLAEVVHPSLAPPKGRKGGKGEDENHEIWTTESGYLKTQERIKQIGTVEMIENAREIEAARALGDLRENSEFKFAQEKRARLQTELKTLSDQLHRARIITPADIHSEEVGIGNRVEVTDSRGEKTEYVILGPWDADPEKNILSFNSKLAQSMTGLKEGDKFDFKNEKYQVLSLYSYLQ